MIALDLFGPCSLSPVKFASLSPADQTLCVRLMFEKMSEMPAATGLKGDGMQRIGAARHQVNMPDQRERHRCERSDDDDLSAPASKILRLFCAEDGPISMPHAEMERRAGLTKGSVRWILESLKERGLIICLRAGKGPRQSTWSVTDAGRLAIAAIAPEAADA
ncbi:winged helix-turn-helix domain-containing protein [Agrobacterium vitis]|uniref:Winged helix-turn-helix domain-containing protein n=1 Tax=Agrobacterium vitis TaxID=373 RepID=A0AAE2RDX9_AGRVI|nr:winged helix-turn-helix domain-containing protein [Agrobacterium vitis]MBF2715704.1 winged helix-turn-helix domain-containing protein [Agrobacterium vitis]